mgnify:CR=1 FL=1
MGRDYLIMPHFFRRLDGNRVVLVNACGDFIFLENSCFDQFVNHSLDFDDDVAKDLESKGFLSHADHDLAVNLAAVKYRTRKGFLDNFTALHMMVITVRCNQKCEYCQVSCEGEDSLSYDMNIETSKKIVDFIFNSPNKDIKIEFQGGEPLLNWETIKSVVEYAQDLNLKNHKNLSFVICTNLTLLTPEKLEYIKKKDIQISTSLDGPRSIHDCNRKLRNKKSSHELFAEKLEMCYHKKFPVSALMTTTKQSLLIFPEIVDEYIHKGFEGIFFRPLNPYGFAHDKVAEIGYTAKEFFEAYKKGFDYIIRINKSGTYFVEFYAQLLLTRILTSNPTGFVDLQSPAGTGISGVIYDYNGNVYPSDEGRMLSRMNDFYFKLGNVYNNTYLEVFNGKKLRQIISDSSIETTPNCGWCVYQLFCGVDPVRNYLETNDLVGFRPGSFFCELHMMFFDMLFDILSSKDQVTIDILWSWVIPKGEVRDA